VCIQMLYLVLAEEKMGGVGMEHPHPPIFPGPGATQITDLKCTLSNQSLDKGVNSDYNVLVQIDGEFHHHLSIDLGKGQVKH